jgi:hypothetical protein
LLLAAGELAAHLAAALRNPGEQLKNRRDDMSPADAERANPTPKDISVIVTGAARCRWIVMSLVAQGWGRIVNHQPFHHGDGRIFALRAVEGRARSRDRDLG